LETLEVIIDLIGATTTSTGLKVYARLDPGEYEKGIKVTDAELAAVNIVRDEFHPDWNYTIHPIPTNPQILSRRLSLRPPVVDSGFVVEQGFSLAHRLAKSSLV
jgi:hypothetical protein